MRPDLQPSTPPRRNTIISERFDPSSELLPAPAVTLPPAGLDPLQPSERRRQPIDFSPPQPPKKARQKRYPQPSNPAGATTLPSLPRSTVPSNSRNAALWGHFPTQAEDFNGVGSVGTGGSTLGGEGASGERGASRSGVGDGDVGEGMDVEDETTGSEIRQEMLGIEERFAYELDLGYESEDEMENASDDSRYARALLSNDAFVIEVNSGTWAVPEWDKRKRTCSVSRKYFVEMPAKWILR
ncbi:hypothetical protein P7C70_g9428, partial [Phenoliferia sp. Uapishka_3]